MSNKRSESLDEMTFNFLACRDKGHHWQHVTDRITDGTKRRVREVTRWYECKTCTTEMHESITLPDFEVRTRKYVYPDGYLLVRGEVDGHRVSVRDVRREMFGRAGIKW